MSRPPFVKRPVKPEPKHRLNERITTPTVRLVTDQSSEIVSIDVALKAAIAASLDLVEISPNANPPVCKVMDYGKFLYQLKKKDKDNMAKNKTEIKELRFSPSISDHDFEVKLKQAIQFLKEGAKVRTQLQFKGREITHKEKGELVLLRLATGVSEVGKAETLPKLEGKKMFMLLTPKK